MAAHANYSPPLLLLDIRLFRRAPPAILFLGAQIFLIIRRAKGEFLRQPRREEFLLKRRAQFIAAAPGGGLGAARGSRVNESRGAAEKGSSRSKLSLALPVIEKSTKKKSVPKRLLKHA